MKIEFLFAWYDLWVGFFWDKQKHWLYIMIPMVGLILKFKHSCCDCKQKKFYESMSVKQKGQCYKCYIAEEYFENNYS